MIKYKSLLKLIIVFLLIFLNCTLISYAGRGDDVGQGEGDRVINMGNAIWVSNFPGGYIELSYGFLDQNRNEVKDYYILYKAAIGYATGANGKTSMVSTFLYELTDSMQDEELRKASQEGKLGMREVFAP